MDARLSVIDQHSDLAVDLGDLEQDGGLETAVLVSLFSDARAEPDVDTSFLEQQPRGWWADTAEDRFGSLLWTLQRAKQTDETLARARAYTRDALAWMIRDEIARTVEVSAAWASRGVLWLEVAIARGSSRRWASVWANGGRRTFRAGPVTLQLSWS